MIDGMKPYPEYKDSGVQWLGEIPAHWKVLPHRALFQEVNERDHPDEPLLSVTIARGVIPQEVLLANSSKKDSSNLDKSNYKLVQPGDITYNKMRAWQGALGVSQYRGIVSPAYIVVRPRRKQVPEYYHYLFRTPMFTSEAERWSYGITSDQWSLRSEDFKRIYGLLPPIEEQAAIARFLTRFDQLTRRYIRAQRRLIELLEEQKQALIQRAVTRGLDPDVPLKDSGVEWIGQIPEHWETRTLSRLVLNIEQGWSPVAAEGAISADQWTVLTLSSVKKGRFYPKAIKPISQTADVPESFKVRPGDFLLTRSNTRDLVGDICVVDQVRHRTILCDLIYRLTIETNALSPRFLMYWLLSPMGRFQIEADARGSSHTMVKISQGHIKGWKVLLPPLHEQTLIADSLDQISEKIEHSITSLGEQINLAREYRTRLIADVGTGKLDVRDVVLPDPEPDDDAADFDDLYVIEDEGDMDDAEN
jgi:type I restriction enzyme S subunit